MIKKTTLKVKTDAFPKLIFIVEDNMMYLKSMQFFLKERFPETEIAIFPLGELCIHNLHLNPDFIILDYFLDTKFSKAANGLEMIRKIRAKKIKAKIIVLSSQDKIGVAVEAVENNQCSYVAKGRDAFEKVYSIIQKSTKKQIKASPVPEPSIS